MTRKRPWVNGLIDGISAANLIRFSTIPHKNRIAFIILDSTLEIAFKKFLVNVKGIKTIDESVWRYRDKINKIVSKNTDFEKEVWEDVDYYYEIRTGLYHEDSEKTVTDELLNEFQELVEFFIDNMFNVICSQLVPVTTSLISFPDQTIEQDQKIGDQTTGDQITKQKNHSIQMEMEANGIPINKIRQKIDVLIISIGESTCHNYDEITEMLKRKGFRGNFDKSIIRIYLNNIYKHMFYFDKYWKLSEVGAAKYKELRKSYQLDDDRENQNG